MIDQLPIVRPALAHQFQAVFLQPPMLTAPIVLPIQPIVPDPAQLRGRPQLLQLFPSFFKAPKLIPPTVLQPLQPVLPSPQNLRGPARRAALYPYLFRPAQFVTPVAPAIPGVGSAGSATFVLGLESGAKTTYSWSTDVMLSYSGKEQRQSTYGSPNRRIDGTAFVVDAVDRDIKGALVRAAAAGSTFLLALTTEAAQISVSSPNSTLNVASTAQIDWALPGQRVVVIGTNGVTQRAIVQSATPTTIPVVLCDASWNFAFGALGATGAAGGMIVPCVQVLLDAVQGFARYVDRVDLWALRARANAYGWAGVDSMGVGATVTTYDDVLPVPVANLTDDSLLIWDRTNENGGTANDSMVTRVDVVDMGALLFSIGGNAVPTWTRPIRMRSSSQDDWQWFKAMVRHLRGMQVAFLLPTHRPDLVPLGVVAGGLSVQSSSVAGAGDYASWFASAAHRRLAVTTTDGAVTYLTVIAVTDNGDGTLTLGVDTLVAGTISMLSLLETVRLDSDDVVVTWDGPTFTAELSAITVQDTPQPPAFLFDTVVNTSWVDPNPSAEHHELLLPIGLRTLINITSIVNNSGVATQGKIGGITATSGNVDGMVVCIPCQPSPSNNQSFDMIHEDTAISTSSRVNNLGSTVVTVFLGSVMYRYNGALQRWLMIGVT